MDYNSRSRRVCRLAIRGKHTNRDRQRIRVLKEKVKKLQKERDYYFRLLVDKGVFPEKPSRPSSVEDVECICGKKAVLVNFKDEEWIICKTCQLKKKRKQIQSTEF